MTAMRSFSGPWNGVKTNRTSKPLLLAASDMGQENTDLQGIEWKRNSSTFRE